MRILIITCFIFSTFLLKAEAPEKKIESKIIGATVFLQGAQVMRIADAAIPAGQSILRFVNLPNNIDPKSIQVKGQGNFIISGVQHEVNYTERPNLNEEQQGLADRIASLVIQTEDNALLMTTLQEEEKLILANRAIGGSNSGVNIDELKAAAAFYRVRLLEIRQAVLLEKRKNIKLNKERSLLQKELDQLRGEKGKYSMDVLVTCNAETSANGKFEISYLVKSAGWFPNYDLRVKDISNPVNLDYKASVFQSSGEDWKDIKLILSTGNPFESGTKPNLQIWRLNFWQGVTVRGSRSNGASYYVDGVRVEGNNGFSGVVSGRVTDQYGEVLIGATIIARGSTVGATTDFDGNFSIQAPPNAQSLIVSYVGYESVEVGITGGRMNVVLSEGVMLEEVAIAGGRSKSKKRERNADRELAAATPDVVPTEIVERTTTVNFVIELPYDILSSGKQTQVQIEEYELPANYQYYVAPKLDLDAFLTAEVVGWEDYDLLSGEANLFFEGTYLGKSFIDVNAVDDTLDISLGRDKNIVIDRVREKEFSKKKFLGDKRVDSRSWTIEVRNKKRQAINLILEDQFPVSSNSDIEVRQGEYNEAKLEEDTGKLTWKFKLAPGTSKKVGFDYSVKYPKNRQVQLE